MENPELTFLLITVFIGFTVISLVALIVVSKMDSAAKDTSLQKH